MDNKNQNSSDNSANPMKEKEQQAGTQPVRDEQQQKQERLWRADAPDIPEATQESGKSTSGGSHQPVRNDQHQNENYLTKEDLPDATNESKGKMGSGQRQDSN